MTERAHIALLPDRRRLHLQDGPIDLIVEAEGAASAVQAAYRAAAGRFAVVLDELCAELAALRRPADPDRCGMQGTMARRMWRAVAPFAGETFITPMAAVAGAVAEDILGTMTGAAPLTRAYVNNGGDIALHLTGRATFAVGLMDRPDRDGVLRTMTVGAGDRVGGIATSGRHGRSFSLGIADAVTVLATTAADADAAATIIANAVDLPGHPAVRRRPANTLQPDSDLGDRLVTTEVGMLSDAEIDTALAAGAASAARWLAAGRIEAAVLQLSGMMLIVGARGLDDARPRRLQPAAA